MSILGALGLAAPLIGDAVNARHIGRQRPVLKNAKRANRKLDAALDQHVDDISPGSTVNYGIKWNTPQPGIEGWRDVVNNGDNYAGSTQVGDPRGMGIKGVTMIPPMPIAAEVINVLSNASSLGRCLGRGGSFICDTENTHD